MINNTFNRASRYIVSK